MVLADSSFKTNLSFYNESSAINKLNRLEKQIMIGLCDCKVILVLYQSTYLVQPHYITED